MTLQILEHQIIQKPNWKIDNTQVVLPIENIAQCIHIGIDPGTANIGVSWIFPERSYVFTHKVTLERNPDPVERISQVANILGSILFYYTVPTYAVIEGSSFGNPYRQTELGEFRAAAVLWCKSKNINVRMLQPTSIRKIVFGSGKIKAEEQWPELPGDAASALACAICSMKMEEGK